jgi:hypothetical protein
LLTVESILLTPLVVPAKIPPINPTIGFPRLVPAYISSINCLGFPIKFKPPKQPIIISITYLLVILSICEELIGYYISIFGNLIPLSSNSIILNPISTNFFLFS